MTQLSALAHLRHAVAKAVSAVSTLTVSGETTECFVKTKFDTNSRAYNLSLEGYHVFELVIYQDATDFFDLLKVVDSRNHAILKTDAMEVKVVCQRLMKQTDGTLYALVSELND